MTRKLNRLTTEGTQILLRALYRKGGEGNMAVDSNHSALYSEISSAQKEGEVCHSTKSARRGASGIQEQGKFRAGELRRGASSRRVSAGKVYDKVP